MARTDTYGALADLLEAEREKLLAGDLLGLERLVDRKQSLLTRLSRTEPDPVALSGLRRDLDRNARLLAAAGQGIRDAIDRVRQLAEPAPLFTYDGTGRRREIEATAPSVSHSA
jgi:flagellar biosynthesis/type III secretory pathway chaperone